MPDSVHPSTQDDELRAHVEQALSASYEVDQEIGRGGMGIVYRARDKRLKRVVAIKLLPPELSFRRDIRSRFLREAETAAQLGHPNIVPIYSVDEVGNLVFFVMACIDGDNLATMLQKRGPLPIENARRWITEVADALAYAHARGVIHRDIKPDNILLDGIDGRALVTDFGIARAMMDSGETSRLTATGMAIGTPAYMSPEQASGDRQLDGRSDLYSLGVVAYQMLIGEPPFIGGTTPALLVKHLAEMPVPVLQRRPDVPHDLAMIVMRLLEKAPEHRFQSATDVVKALKTGIVPPAPMSASFSGNGAPIPLTGAPVGGMALPGATAGAPRPSTSASLYSPPPYQANTQMPAAAPPSLNRYPSSNTGEHAPTPSDLARWEAPPVVAFRRKLAPYLFINFALFFLNIFGNTEMWGISTLWTIYIVWKYTKLWSDGFDWKDVLRQPRHRLLGEVISDFSDGVQATFSRAKREELRAQGKLRNRLSGVLSPIALSPLGRSTPHGASAGAGMGPGGASVPIPPVRDDELGEYAGVVRGARADREEIARLLATIPTAERSRIPEVANTAIELVNKIETIALDLARIDREEGGGRMAAVDAEIASLESEANPLDSQRSEARVRRLAQLRRDRRALTEGARKRESRRGQLESCRIALENVRLDLVRLRTGNSSVQSVTLIAEQAMALAREVDIAVSAAQEVRDVVRTRPSNVPA